MADKKDSLADTLYHRREHGTKTYADKDVQGFAREYAAFLTQHKTEREVIASVVEQAKQAGFTDLATATTVENGGTYYLLDSNKNVALIRFAGLGAVQVVASHADSPCLHLKPYPVAEKSGLAVMKSHYYGGIKKYQWVNLPLALHGVAFTKNGKKVEVCIGESPDDPVFTIPDLLPHLARDQLDKKLKEGVEGEQLNPILATIPHKEKDAKDPVKLAAMHLLHERYGLVEEDLVSAELLFVPAGPARDAGLDASMITGYGHDDRVCVYTSLRAMLAAKPAPFTQLALFYDKEEIGSYGKTGAQNLFLTRLFEELIDLSSADLRPSQVWTRTKILSADVTSAIDPNFSDVHDSSNACTIGYGVAVEKYGGGGGKYSTSDADAEYMHAILSLLREHKVPWQTGENGKVDVGGGGTIAMYLAQHGADVIDLGIPVLGMHAPYEVVSKVDVYALFQAYKAFYTKKL